MQVVLNSNSSSLVQNTLTKAGSVGLDYSTEVSFPNVSKRNNLISPYIGFSGAPDSQSATFKIPRSNMLDGAELKFTCNSDLASVICQPTLR